MEDIRLELAQLEDRSALMAFYRALIGTPCCYWDEEYPDETITREDLAAGRILLLRGTNGDILATIALTDADETEYAALDCFTKGNYIELGRLGVRMDHQGRGLAKRLFLAACRYAVELGYEGVHFIAVTENARARHIYDSLGVRHVGDGQLYHFPDSRYEASRAELLTLLERAGAAAEALPLG